MMKWCLWKMFKRWEGQTNNTTWWSIFKSIFKHSIKNTSLSPLLVLFKNVKKKPPKEGDISSQNTISRGIIIVYNLEFHHGLGDTIFVHSYQTAMKSPGVQSSETERNVLGQVLLQKHTNVTRKLEPGKPVTCYDDHPNLAASVLVEEFICLMIDWKCIIFFLIKDLRLGEKCQNKPHLDSDSWGWRISQSSLKLQRLGRLRLWELWLSYSPPGPSRCCYLFKISVDYHQYSHGYIYRKFL